MTDVVGQAPLVIFPRAQLRDLVQGITGQKVIWDDEPIPFVGQRNGKPGWYVELAIIATASKGIDDVRLDYDPINQVNGVTQVTYRLTTVQFKVVSFDPMTPAYAVMDQIRRGLRSDSAKNEFMNINLALVDWDNSHDAVQDRDNRAITESTCSIKWAWSVSIDPGDNAGGVITSAPVTGTLTP